jgi:hypothetical protein
MCVCKYKCLFVCVCVFVCVSKMNMFEALGIDAAGHEHGEVKTSASNTGLSFFASPGSCCFHMRSFDQADMSNIRSRVYRLLLSCNM